jgi:hypothetical protein
VGLGVIVTIAVAGEWLVEESDAAWRAEGTFWHRVLMLAPIRWLTSRSPSARAFLFRRFTPSDYLGLNLTLGLGLSFVALVIFSAIANSILARDALPQFDLQLAAALRETATPSRVEFWKFVSRLGRLPVVAVPASRSRWCSRGAKRVGYRGGFRRVDGRKRDHRRRGEALLRAPAYACCGGHRRGDGHAEWSSAWIARRLWMIAYFLILMVHGHRTQVLIALCAAALILTICFGRLYLGDRYFSDVVSGLAAGAVWLSACLTAWRWRVERGTHGRGA